MPCVITVSSVTGVPVGSNTELTIIVTVVGCTGNLIVVTVTCGTNTFTQNVTIPGGQIKQELLWFWFGILFT